MNNPDDRAEKDECKYKDFMGTKPPSLFWEPNTNSGHRLDHQDGDGV